MNCMTFPYTKYLLQTNRSVTFNSAFLLTMSKYSRLQSVVIKWCSMGGLQSLYYNNKLKLLFICNIGILYHLPHLCVFLILLKLCSVTLLIFLVMACVIIFFFLSFQTAGDSLGLMVLHFHFCLSLCLGLANVDGQNYDYSWLPVTL